MTLRRNAALLVWLAFVAACALVVSRTQFTTDMSAFMPRDPSPTQKIMVEQLRDGMVSRLILVGVDGAPVPVLARLSKDMAAALRAAPELAAVNNGEPAGMEKDYELLWRNRYLLSDAVTPQHFSAAGLRDSLHDYLDLLATPMGGMAQRVLADDPSGEIVHLLEQMQGETRPAQQDDVWFSRDGTRAMLLAHTSGAGNDIDAQERAMLAIRRAFEAAQKSAPEAAPAELRMTGPGVFSVQSRASIRDDVMRLSFVATLLVAGMLLLLYRSPRVLGLGLLPVATGALAGVAAVSLGFGNVHGITLGFGVTLLGEGVDYAIYLFTRIERGGSAQSTLQRIWPTLRIGVLTSFCGFSVMLFSGFTGLAQLGLFSTAGLLVAVAVTRWLLPELMPQGFFIHPPARLGGALTRLIRLAPRLRPALFALVAAALVTLLLQRDALWNDSLAGMSPVAPESLALDEQLRGDLGAPDVRYMVVLHSADEEDVLQQSEAVAAAMGGLMARGMLAGFDMPPLPSRRTQLARQAALPGEAELRRNLRQALQGMPFRKGLFDAFPQHVASAKRMPLLDRAALQGTALGLKLDSFMVRRADGWTVMLPLRGVRDAAGIERGLQQAAQRPLLLLDMKRESEQMLKDFRHEAAKNALIGGCAILVLLFASLRSPRRVFNVALPLLVAGTVLTAGLLASGHSLTIFHLIGLLLVAAVGSNYTLFFDHRSSSPQERERTVTSLLFANASTVCGFGVLAFSQSPVLSGIGTTVAVGAVLSLLFAAILIVRREE